MDMEYIAFKTKWKGEGELGDFNFETKIQTKFQLTARVSKFLKLSSLSLAFKSKMLLFQSKCLHSFEFFYTRSVQFRSIAVERTHPARRNLKDRVMMPLPFLELQNRMLVYSSDTDEILLIWS